VGVDLPPSGAIVGICVPHVIRPIGPPTVEGDASAFRQLLPFVHVL